MLNGFFRFIKGSVSFEGEGKFPERFLNLTVRSGIHLWNAHPSKKGISGCMTAADYRRIRPAAKKSQLKLRVTKKRGLPFIIAKYKNRKGLFAGAAAGIALIIFLSCFVWTIEINGCETVSRARLERVLAENGLCRGSLRRSLDVSKIKRETLLKVDELGWMSVNLSGGRAVVEVREKVRKPKINTREKPCNIKASADGVITDCKVRNGVLTVTKGSGVIKGEMLVSGVVGSEQNTVRYICADADIFADVNSKKEIYIPKTYEYNSVKENKTERSRLFLFNFSLPCTMAYQSFDSAVYTDCTQSLVINGVTLPLGLKTETARELSSINATPDKKQARAAAENSLALYEAFEKGGSVKVKRELKISEDKNGYRCGAEYIFNENIAKTVDFTVNEE